jgi:hypothetical protein
MSAGRRIVVTQSNYIPWRGYFDLIDEADVLVVYDDVQYTKNDWRNRNKIKTSHGLHWLTAPVRKAPLHTAIDEIELDLSRPWRRMHLETISVSYRKTPGFGAIFEGYREVLERAPPRLSALNVSLLRWLMQLMEIRTEIVDVRSLSTSGHRTERLIGIVRELGGAVYLSGPSAASYLDAGAFRRAGIGLEYKSYVYPDYPQLWGPFEGGVSVLDMLFNVGAPARGSLKSLAPNVKVV